MRTDLQKFVDDYMLMMGQKHIFHMVLDQPGVECVATLLEILKEHCDPKLKLRILTDWEHWLKEQYPDLFNQQVAPVPVVLSKEQQHALALEQQVRMGDILQLVPLTDTAKTMLERRGAWWRTVQAHDHDPKKPHVPGTRPPSWFIKSLTRKEQGLPAIGGDKKSPFDNMWIQKRSDPNYRIINICSFPKEFKHKEWVGVENVVRTTFDK